MKRISILLFLIFSNLIIYAQTDFETELEIKVNEKKTFLEKKETILKELNEKLKKVDIEQKTELKKLKKLQKHWNRKLWIDEHYIGNDGTAHSKSKIDYKSIKLIKKLKNNKQRAQNEDWELLGPISVSAEKGIGRCDRIAFHPTDPDILFAGSSNGGLFKSINGGENWQCLTDFLPSLGVAGIAIHPTNPDILYFLSGDAYEGNWDFYRAPSLGVFKSIDGGNVWQLQNIMDDSFRSRDLLINPTSPDILIAATSKGVFRSVDAGVTWIQSNINIDGAVSLWNDHITDIEFKSDDSNVIFAVSDDDFFKSTDNGITFQEVVVNGLTDNGGVSIVIGVTQDNPNRVYLHSDPAIDTDGDGEFDSFQGFYTSIDAGESFSLVTNAFPLPSAEDKSDCHQPGYNIAIGVNPLDEDEIYVGGIVSWHSIDGGLTWDQSSDYWNWDLHPDQHDIRFHPLTNEVFFANDGGIYKNDGSWESLFNGLSCATFYRFELENQDDDLWGGCQDNGMLAYDGSGTFSQFSTGDGFDSITDHNYTTSGGGGNDHYYSQNASIYCDGLICNISVPGNNNFFANLDLSPIDDNLLYAGYSQALFRSNNAGSDWDSLSNRPANWAISTCPSNNDIVYLAGSNSNYPSSRIFKYTNPSSWEDLTPGLVSVGYNINLKISDIEVEAADHNRIYVISAGVDSGSKVFFSDNGGSSWQNISFDLPNVPFFSIELDENNNIYAGSNAGVFFKSNGQDFWHYFANGLPPVPVTDIELSPGGGPYTEIYISTYGRGIWKTSTNAVCPSFKTLTNTIEWQSEYEAGQEIISTQKLQSVNASLKLNTGDRIILQPGFHAPSGTYFKTFDLGCGANIDD